VVVREALQAGVVVWVVVVVEEIEHVIFSFFMSQLHLLLEHTSFFFQHSSTNKFFFRLT
jgi:hypothetical protein